MRDGIPTIEVFIGDYLEPWEIEELKEKIRARVEKARLENVLVIAGKRNTDMTVLAGPRTRDI